MSVRTLEIISIIVVALMLVSLTNCAGNGTAASIRISNPLAVPRFSETVSIPVADLKTSSYPDLQKITVAEKKSGRRLVTQLVDDNTDGTVDALLFQIDIGGAESKDFLITQHDDASPAVMQMPPAVHGRFVPERLDDFAWENDRVAFRIYGPAAQQLVEDGKEGGTLSSGVDCWLKKVSYPIIDNWYQQNLKTPGYYHADHGEGYDPYHVGSSLGCGGIGIMKDETLYTSKNFVDYRVIADGPVRVIFEVNYAQWIAGDQTITTRKRISLDAGSNLSLFEIEMESNRESVDVAIGITLHEKKGVSAINEEEGWLSYWEPVDRSELGTGVVIDRRHFKSAREFQTDEPDRSHLFVMARPIGGRLAYYAGFGWSGSAQFKSRAEWENYLSAFSRRRSSPLIVSYP